MRLRDAFVNRRSALNFKEDFTMNEIDFNMIFELAKFSPSVFNTQATRYLIISDKEKQAELKALSGNQHKILTASGVIILLGNKDFLEEPNVKQIYNPMLNLKMISQEEYNTMLQLIKQFRASLSEEALTAELHRNVYLNAGVLISIIAVLGFDSCPMHAHNTEEVKKLFNIPDNYEVLLLLPVGKAVDKQRLRGYRHPVSELIKFQKYS